MASLSACAEGADGADLGGYSLFDSGVVQEEEAGWEQEAGVILPPQNGPVVPDLPVDASAARDSSTPAQPKPDASPPSTPVDSGTPKPMDASTPAPQPVDAATPPKPDTGTPPSANTCATTPAYATPTTCSKCACSKCGAEVTACYASGDTTKNSQCAAIEACAETSKCTGESCFCGTSLTCLFPDGACRTQIEAASGSGSLTDVQAARDDATSSVAHANAVGACRLSNCKSECGL